MSLALVSWPRMSLALVSWPPVSWPPASWPRMSLPLVSWPGLARPPTSLLVSSPHRSRPTSLHQPNRKIVPLRIPTHDQANFPRPRPTLQACLALNHTPHVTMGLTVHQAVEVVPPRKRRPDAVLVRPHASRQIARHAQIQRPVRTVGHDVNPSGGHSLNYAQSTLRNRLRPRGSSHRHPRAR